MEHTMTTVSKLAGVRPRFVYLWVWLQAIPIPIGLFVPLVVLELLLRRLGQPAASSPHLIWELRKMPPSTLVEVEVRPKTSQRIYVRIGLW